MQHPGKLCMVEAREIGRTRLAYDPGQCQLQPTRKRRRTPLVLMLVLGTCSLATALSTQAPPSAQSFSSSSLVPLYKLQHRGKTIRMMTLTDSTNMFLSAPASSAASAATQTSSVRITAGLHLTLQDLIHSRRYRDRGILGFTVDDHSIDSHNTAKDVNDGDSSSSSSSLHASSRRSSNADAMSDAPWQHMGEEAEEEEELAWTSMNSWSSQNKQRSSQYSVWKNSNNNFMVSSLPIPVANKDDDQAWIPSAHHIHNMNSVQLKAALSDRGLSTTGKKEEQRDRLSDWATAQRELPRPREPSLSVTNMYQNYGVQTQSPSFLPKHKRPNTHKKGPSGGREDDNWRPSSFQDEEDFSLDAGETPNSLAEWSRTVDLEPLFQRREAIHREKQVGKPAKRKQKQRKGRTGNLKQESLVTKEDYISVLKKMFDDSSSSRYSNYEVKKIYAAAKEADKIGDRGLSKRILMELKEATPHDMRIYRRLSRMEKEEGNIAGARSILQEGLRLDRENAFLWLGLGQLAASDDEAKKHYRKAIQFNPSLPMPHHALGTLEHTQGHIAAAMKTLKKGLEYCPTNHRLHHALGDLYREAKMLGMAQKCYQRAVKHGPPVSHGFAYKALAFVAYEDNKPNQCRAWLRKAVSLNEGRHASSWVSWAKMEEAEGNIDAARTICMAAVAKYERGLLKRANVKSSKGPIPSLSENANATATQIRDQLMKEVPTYRSGDKFCDLYRTWARLEGCHGSTESVEEVHRRAFLAFPTEWKLTVDWAEHYCRLNMYERASELFSLACTQASGRHGDPYRLYAEYEMARGNYEKAQTILFRGAVALSQTAGGGLGNRIGMVELYYVWAVCEWHLENLARAENLFDHALQLTALGEEGSQTRCLILFAMAQLQHSQDEPLLAQHCIGLCLKENRMIGGTSKVWELWAAVANEMENDGLSAQCHQLAETMRAQEASDQTRLLELLSPANIKSRPSVQQMMRRDPWHYQIFSASARQRSTSFHSVQLPVAQEEGQAV